MPKRVLAQHTLLSIAPTHVGRSRIPPFLPGSSVPRSKSLSLNQKRRLRRVRTRSMKPSTTTTTTTTAPRNPRTVSKGLPPLSALDSGTSIQLPPVCYSKKLINDRQYALTSAVGCFIRFSGFTRGTANYPPATAAISRDARSLHSHRHPKIFPRLSTLQVWSTHYMHSLIAALSSSIFFKRKVLCGVAKVSAGSLIQQNSHYPLILLLSCSPSFLHRGQNPSRRMSPHQLHPRLTR